MYSNKNKILFFDLETTGTSISKDKIVQISCVKTEFDLIPIEETRRNIFINPGIPIPKGASDVHGITDEIVKDKPLFSKIANGFINYINEDVLIIAGYNSNDFDIPLLYEEFANCNIEFELEHIKFIDCCVIFKKKEKRDLSAALKFYCQKEMIGAHDAGNDVNATLEILDGQLFYYGFDLESAILDSLYDSKNEIYLDFARKIKRNSEGIICYAFGKSKDVPVKNDIGFAEWMLRNDFSKQTKNVLLKIINGEIK